MFSGTGKSRTCEFSVPYRISRTPLLRILTRRSLSRPTSCLSRPGATEEEQLRSIRRYRETFSRLLVVGSRLRQLEGKRRQIFLRAKTDDFDARLNGEETLEGEEAGRREMEEMNVTDGAVEIEMEDGEVAMEMSEGDGKKGGEKRKQGKRRRAEEGRFED